MKKYAICRHGNKITVKRTDHDNDFGDIINERDTLPEARLCARVERMALRQYLTNNTQSKGCVQWRLAQQDKSKVPAKGTSVIGVANTLTSDNRTQHGSPTLRT